MADKKKANNTSGKGKLLVPSALAIADNLVFSKTDYWAYYRISTTVYDFLSTQSKNAVALQTANALTNIMGNRREPLDCHLIVTSVPIDLDNWSQYIKDMSADWDRSPGFNSYLDKQLDMLQEQQYLKKAVFLGIHLGKRGALDFENLNFLELGLKGAVDQLKKWWTSALRIPGNEISPEEEDNARKKEAEIFRTLANGNLQATRMTSEDILLTIKRQMYPSMPIPYLTVDHENRLGPGDMELELSHAIENKYRWLKINQIIDGEELEGYRACLSFSKFPRYMSYPNGTIPFFYLLSAISLPFTMYSRFRLIPSEGMKKNLEKKRKEMVDEQENVAASGQTAGAAGVVGGSQPAEVSDALEDMHQITSILAGDKTPWVQGSYRIVVETPDEETIRKYCSIVRQRFSDMDINVSWTAGDQAELFLEQMPGDHVRVKSFEQITNLNFLATSGFRNADDVGDLIYGSEGGK